MSVSELPDTHSSRIGVGMNLAGCILLALLSVSYTATVGAAEESPPGESSQSKTPSADDAPTGTSERPVEEFEVESSEEQLDTFVPSEQISPDSSISFPVDI